MVVMAHDNVGSHWKAHLQLWADGWLIGELDVLKNQSELNFNVGRYVNKLELKSVNQDHLSGGDETVVLRITTY
jgi:hypothetical protein